MANVYDAVHWENLQALNGPVLGYADGPVSKWPPEALKALGARVVGLITVLADQTHSIFDSEAGNAGVDAVATAVANRAQSKLPSTVYTNADNQPGLTQALRRKGVTWADRQFWPRPGCYLWAAAPGTPPGLTPSWCPVSPVAVQDRWMGGYDVSTAFVGWPVVTAPPKPPPPAPQPAPTPSGGLIEVLIPQLRQNATGPSVRALQRLLGDVTVDGIFGPNTHQAVLTFQSANRLGADGIVGTHTWGALLGHPQ
jgi:peptidoglycan hydrolase-like protein with peptidoglycan-binding domain